MVGMQGQLLAPAVLVAAAWQPGMHDNQHHDQTHLWQSIMGYSDQGVT